MKSHIDQKQAPEFKIFYLNNKSDASTQIQSFIYKNIMKNKFRDMRVESKNARLLEKVLRQEERNRAKFSRGHLAQRNIVSGTKTSLSSIKPPAEKFTNFLYQRNKGLKGRQMRIGFKHQALSSFKFDQFYERKHKIKTLTNLRY